MQITLEEVDTGVDYIKLKLNGHPIQFKKGMSYMDATKHLKSHLQQMAGDTKSKYGLLLDILQFSIPYFVPSAHGHPLVTAAVVVGPPAFSLITTAIVYWTTKSSPRKQEYLKTPSNWNIQ